MKRFRFISLLIILSLCVMSGSFAESSMQARQKPLAKINVVTEPEKLPYEQTIDDELGLVTLRLDHGEARLDVPLKMWDELYQVTKREFPFSYQLGNEVTGGEDLVISTFGKWVMDGKIAQVKALSPPAYEEVILPTVALIMENGRVEFVLASPFIAKEQTEVYSEGRLPWLRGVTEIVEEKNRAGETSLVAIDYQNNRWDLAQVQQLSPILRTKWMTNLEYDGQYAELYLRPHGSFSYAMFDVSGEVLNEYESTYTIQVDGQSDPEITLEFGPPIGEDPEFSDETIAVYKVAFVDDRMILYYAGQDSLPGGVPETITWHDELWDWTYPWEDTGSSGYQDEPGMHRVGDPIGYLVEHVAEVRTNLEQGMSLMITDQVGIIDEMCTIVSVGNNLDDQFVQIHHYAIGTESGNIYVLNILDDLWHWVYSPE